MGIEATVVGGANEERVLLVIRADQPGRVVGKRGSTLSSIRHILRLMLTEHGDPIIDVDVDKTGVEVDLTPRKRERKPRERKENNRNDRGRGQDRGQDRGRGRGRDRDRDRDQDDDRKGRVSPDTLKALAQRAAEKAIESGKVITITKELNSYDRRVVHMEIADLEGISSRSEEKDGLKYVQIIPE
jgi:predicted RNA-binding protein Jag